MARNMRKILQIHIPLFAKSVSGGLDNCGKNHQKADLAQSFPVFVAAMGGAAAVEGELLRQAKRHPFPFMGCYTQ
jgi:hypothetical protein